MEDQCRKCQSTLTEVRPNNKLFGLYCSECGAWIRWLKKAEYPPTEAELSSTNEIEIVSLEVKETCDYCEKEYVIPIAWDGGISGWENIEHKYCPICGRPTWRM